LKEEARKNFNILAVLVIFRRDSDSLFAVVDGVLLLVCLFSFELAAKDKILYWIK